MNKDEQFENKTDKIKELFRIFFGFQATFFYCIVMF